MAAMLTIFLLTLTVLGCSCARSNMKCPMPEAIPNCYCMSMSFLFRGPYVVCSDIRNIDDLRQSIQGLKGNPIEALRLYNVSLDSFPRDGLFVGTHIEYLWLSYSNLKTLAPRDQRGASPFTGLEHTLTEVKIDGLLNLDVLDWTEFSEMKKLTRIEVYNSQIGQIDSSFTKLPSSFVVFSLLMGSLTSITEGAFALDNITSVSVEMNNIPTLNRNIFGQRPTKLVNMLLSVNRIKVLSEDFFSNLPALTFADISRNQLTNLPTSLRDNWGQFESLYLQGNLYNCNCDLVWLLQKAKQQPPKYSDLEFVKCASPPALAKKALLDLEEKDFCP